MAATVRVIDEEQPLRRSRDSGLDGEESTGARRTAINSGVEAPNGRLWWTFCNVAIHIIWGFYPVAARWLQTRPAEPLPPFRLTFYINAIACIALCLCVTIPQTVARLGCPRHNGGSRGSQTAGDCLGSQGPPFRQQAYDVAVFAVCLGVLAVCGVIASRYTSAYLVQLVFTTSPLWTALVAAAVLREAPPKLLWPSFGATLVGSALVVGGALHAAPEALTWQDPLGLVLALIATLAISIYFVYVSKTTAWLPESAILYINYFSALSFAPLVSALFETGKWVALFGFNLKDWVALLYASAGVYGFAKYTQQIVIRKIGATQYALFISVRLVAAVAGSSLILDEAVGGLEIVGCVIVCASVSCYVWASG